jgi:hypothetical protein
MDFSLSTIASALPVSLSTGLAGKRKLALHSPSKPQSPITSSSEVLTASNASSWCNDDATANNNNNNKDKIVFKHKDSFLVYLEHAASVLSLKQLEEDDDTATTVSFTSASASSENSLRVSFPEDPVTQVHYRPYTSKQDKYFLHYNEHDYVDFKMEYLTGKGRNRKVGFKCEDAVVHQLPAPNATKQDLFYSEQELQGFLDEFVQSLNHHQL